MADDLLPASEGGAAPSARAGTAAHVQGRAMTPGAVWWSIAAIRLAVAMCVIDESIVNVALPVIGRSLNASASESIWLVNAYQVAMAIGVLPAAAIGERVGHRCFFLCGLVLFTLASVSCTMGPTLPVLALSRFIQGLGASAVLSIYGAMLRGILPPEKLGRAIGLNASVVAATLTAGPAVAAGVLTVGSWRWLFGVNVPIGLLVLTVGLRVLPNRGPKRTRVDAIAIGLNALALGGLFLAGADVAHRTLGPQTAVWVLVGVVALVLLFMRERGVDHPLIPTDLFASRLMRLSYATSSCSFAAYALSFVSLPFILIGRHGCSVVGAGLMMTPLPIATAITAPLAGRLADRRAAGPLCATGLFIYALALATFAAVPARSAPILLLGPIGLAGVGFGLFQTPNNRLLLSSAPLHRTAAAGGMLAVVRLIGQITGAIIAAFILARAATGSVFPLFGAAGLAAVGGIFSLSRGGDRSAAATRTG